MNLAAWAERNGVARVTAYRWFRAGCCRYRPGKVGRLILVGRSVCGSRATRTNCGVCAGVLG